MAPWIQGLFGGAGATLLWEAFLKPARDRRSLAAVLLQESSHNLEYATAHRRYLQHNSRGLPADFHLSDLVFRSVTDRIGELSGVSGLVVISYRQIEALNSLPSLFQSTLREYQQARLVGGKPEQALKAELASILEVYRTTLDALIERLEDVRPKLASVATPWYRFGRTASPVQLLNEKHIEEQVRLLQAGSKRDMAE
jgi:hypothetical protein